MKKLTFAIVLMLLSQYSSFAQDIRFGVQASPSFSWLKTDDTKINSNGTAFGAKLGLVGEYNFRENYSVCSGIGFHFNTGGTLRHDLGGQMWPSVDTALFSPGTDLKYHVQYVEIPLSLKLRTQEFGYIRYYAELPIITFGFRSGAKGDIEGSASSDQKKLNIKEEVNGANISWGFGGGIEYGISQSTALVGGIYYQQGFADVTQDGRIRGDGNKDNSKATIGSVSIRIGVLF